MVNVAEGGSQALKEEAGDILLFLFIHNVIHVICQCVLTSASS